MYAEMYAKKPIYPDIEENVKCDLIDGKYVTFLPSTHTYTVGNTPFHVVSKDCMKSTSVQEFYKSVSGIIKSFTPEFKGSTKKTERTKMLSKNEVKRLWKMNAEYATNKGSFIHKCLELYIMQLQGKELTEYEKDIMDIGNKDSEIALYMKQVMIYLRDNILSKYGYNYNNLELERIVADHEHRKCGQCDLRTDDRMLIMDYKTNGSDMYKSYGSLLEPFDDIPNSSIEKYFIQIGLYAELMDAPKNAKGKILHLNDCKLKVIRVNMAKYRRIAREMLEAYEALK